MARLASLYYRYVGFLSYTNDPDLAIILIATIR
jgi:hypothetical protein